MAKKQQAKKHKGERNDDRKNGKAWKRRECCGRRHGPDRCT